ncbi:MAG: hypothetical protein RLZ45_2317 [Verrucomicrobiota bacterium]|jgi:LysM repeat protein
MSTPNPLIPQGSLLEQQARSKSTFQMAAFIVALHVIVLGGFLFLGCKKEENQAQTPAPTDTLATPPPVVTDTNAPVVADAGLTNTQVVPPPVEPVTNANLTPVPAPVDPGMSTSTTPPPIVPVTPPPASGAEYVVQKGDSGFIIAKKNGVTLKQLQEANPGKNLAKLSIGAKLVLPAGAGAGAAAAVETKPAPAGRESIKTAPVKGGESYTVKGGDNLGRLAKKFGTSVKAIRDANGLQGSDIRVGQKLKIPTKAGAPAASSDPAPVAPVDNTPVTPAPVAPAPSALPVVTPAVPAPITPPAPR